MTLICFKAFVSPGGAAVSIIAGSLYGLAVGWARAHGVEIDAGDAVMVTALFAPAMAYTARRGFDKRAGVDESPEPDA